MTPADRAAGVLAALEVRTWRARAAVTVEAWSPEGEPEPPAVALSHSDFRPFTAGSRWGPPWGTTWFRLSGTVPPEWAGSPVAAALDLGWSPWPPGFQAEALVVDASGRPLHGLHPRRRTHHVTDSAAGGEPFEVLIEAAANPAVTSFSRGGADLVNTLGGEPCYVLLDAALVVPARDVEELWADLDVLRTLLLIGTAGRTPANRIDQARDSVESACDLLAPALAQPGALPPDVVAAARAALRPALAVPASPDAPRLALVGHAHLDTAWLWPVRETVRKAVRTAANVLELMDAHPGMTFAGSQAAQHAWLRDRHPDLWRRLASRVDEGRWVPVGGMWVESDVLLPSGESLARQLVHGQRFFRDELGRPARTGWLPDCFGFTPALPQLLRQAGLDSFVTQKLSWNDTNHFPHSTFWWEGLDGSRVLAHFPTVDTYNAELSALDVERAVTAGAADALVPFGHGDGGGGPTRVMLDRADRMRDLDGLPRARHADPDVVLTALRDEGLPVWRGDLYLETHRGVWTSQRATKLGDARCDEALRLAEEWCAAAALRTGRPYPHDELDSLWRRHLLLEFHDILPGTSITRVHEEAVAEHTAVLSDALRVRDAAAAAVGEDTRRQPPAARPVAPVRTHDGWLLDNGLLRARVDDDGHLASLVDLTTGRDLVPAGEPMGVLHLHDDRPTAFDAWNLDRTYLGDRQVLGAADEVRSTGSGVTAVRRFGGSSASHTWWVADGTPAVSLRIDVEWRERDRILKLAVPVDVTGDEVTAGVQHGLVRRRLRPRTTWERARYEDWFHGFLAVGDDTARVGVVTADCHGYDSVDSAATPVLRPSLLRGPTFPDPTCDLGEHSFRFDLYVGAADADLVAAARAARIGLLPGAARARPDVVRVSGPGVVVDAITLAADRSGDMVLRLNQATGVAAHTVLDLPAGVVSARLCDLLERPLDDVPVVGRTVSLDLPPFAVRTLRLTWAAVAG